MYRACALRSVGRGGGVLSVKHKVYSVERGVWNACGVWGAPSGACSAQCVEYMQSGKGEV